MASKTDAPQKTLGGSMSCSSRLKKLFTKEDPMHLHKTLGLLSVVHYLYRYFYVYPLTGNLGLENATAAVAVGALLHVALSTSSLIFTVIKSRLAAKPMIIYEEYRLHAIVFTIRGFSVFLFGYFCQNHWPVADGGSDGYGGSQNISGTGSNSTAAGEAGTYVVSYGKGTDAHWIVLYCLVMAHHILVDKITDWYGDDTQTTVRAGNHSGPFFSRVLRFYSLYQFLALASHLTVNPTMMDSGWNPTIAVQSSAFCMTLYRKRLIRGKTHAFWYTACLLLSIYHILRVCEDGSFAFVFKVFFIFGLRVHFGANKYILWAGYTLISMPTVDGVLSQAVGQAMAVAATFINSTEFLVANGLGNTTADQAGVYAAKISTTILASYCMLAIKKPRKRAEPISQKNAEVATETNKENNQDPPKDTKKAR